MTTKEYLLQVNRSRRALKSYEEEIERLQNEAAGLRAITYDTDRVQVSPDDNMLIAVARLMDIEAKYVDAISVRHDLILKITNQINGMANQDYAEILRLRYLATDREGKLLTWTAISHRIHRSLDWTWHMHGRALQAFGKQYLQ